MGVLPTISRWYLFALGILLTIFGIGGLVVAPRMVGARGGTIASSIIWLATALVAYLVAAMIKDAATVRAIAGVIGVGYLAWGIVGFFSSTALAVTAFSGALATVSGLLILVGAFGLASALVPATWLYHEGMAPAQ